MITTTTKQYLDLLQQAEEATNRATAIKLINRTTVLLEQMSATKDVQMSESLTRHPHKHQSLLI